MQEVGLTLMLHSGLVSSFVSSGLALPQNHWPSSALEGLARASLERRDIEALASPFEGIC